MFPFSFSAFILAGGLLAGAAGEPNLPSIVINDNRRPAGVLENGTLTLRLRAGVGLWRPEGESGPALRIEAFGEGQSPLTVPAPLLRVPEGTLIAASLFLRRRERGRRSPRSTPLRRPATTRGHAAHAGRRDDGDDVDA